MQRTKLIAWSGAFCLAGLLSCKKSQEVQKADAAGPVVTMAAYGKMSFSNWPGVDNGVLVFKTQSQFDEYISFLEATVDPQNYDSVQYDKTNQLIEFDQDQLLQNVEVGLGFTSARRIAHDKFLRLNAIGWDRLEDIPEEHFIPDVVMRSVLNADLTVKIADNYVHYINKQLSVRVAATQPALLTAFSKLPVTATVYDAMQIDPTHKYSTLFEVQPSGGVATYGGGSVSLGVGDLSVINLAHEAANCNNPKEITFGKMQLFQEWDQAHVNGGSLPAAFTVDFGDNTPTVTISSVSQNTSGTLFIVPNFTHAYAAAGDYTVKVHAVANYVYGGATANYANLNYPITVTGTACDVKEKEGDFVRKTTPDGSRAVAGKIRVQLPDPLFNSKKTRIIAETWSYLRDGNKWKESKAEIWGELHTNRMKEGCVIEGPVDGDAWASNSKHITVHRTNNRYPWYIVNTNHGIKYNGIWVFQPLTLSVCN